MNAEELKRRTKMFGLDVIHLLDEMSPGKVANTIGSQLLRSATSVGANYRAACRGRSKPEFIAKIGIAIEEADESLYWMELLCESGIMSQERLKGLMNEANEIIAILSASSITARSSLSKGKYGK